MDHNDGLSEIVEEIVSNLGYRNIQILKMEFLDGKKLDFFYLKEYMFQAKPLVN